MDKTFEWATVSRSSFGKIQQLSADSPRLSGLVYHFDRGND